MDRPPLRVIAADQPAGEVEELVRAFFRSELPNPWPELAVPPTASEARPRDQWSWRSRILLAASVAFLLVSTLALADRFRDQGGPAAIPRGATAAARFPAAPGVPVRDKAPAGEFKGGPR